MPAKLPREVGASRGEIVGLNGSLQRRIPHAGTYTRSLPVSLERLYENALDWEHLPWLHRSSFFSIELQQMGDWGWRAEVGIQPREKGRTATLELILDRPCRRWITRTLAGSGEGTEIWTHAFAVAERRTDIVVDFFVPGKVEPELAPIGELYRDLYARLYDEDVSMMTQRQQQLDRIKERRSGERDAIRLGRLEDLRPRLPVTLEIAGAPFRIDQLDGELVLYSLVCPHLLGPLGEAEVLDGVIECPWHGYRFDVRSGRSVGGQPCRLTPPPTLSIDPVTGEVAVTG